MKLFPALILTALLLGCSREKKSELELGLEAVAQAQDTIIPIFSFQNANTEDAVNFIALQIKKKHPDFEYIISRDSSIPDRKINLSLKDVPASDALRYMSALGGWTYNYSGARLQLSNNRKCGSEFTYGAFKFPEKILFDSTPGREEFIDAKPLLEKMGLQFPKGSQAVYRRSREILIVRNTQDQIDLIGKILEESKKH